MRYEAQNASPKPGVLAYATLNEGDEWLPPPVWLRRAVIVGSLLILTLFLLGLPPLSGALDYTRNIPLSEAVEYARAKGVRGTLDSPAMIRVAMFAPIAIAGLLAFLYLRGIGQRVALLVNLLLPAVWLAHFLPFLVVGGPVILFLALIGQSDGETWSEGLVCYAAMASWTTLWLATRIALLVLKRARSAQESS